MPTQRSQRRRACEACHVAKIRCELSLPRPSTPPRPCQRCRRIGKECVLAKSRRQKHRISALEAQVQQLSQALGNQESSTLHTVAGGEREHVKLEEPDSDLTRDLLAFLDSHVSLRLQQDSIQAYNARIGSVLPLVPIVNADVHYLRYHSPLLLLSVLAFPIAGVITQELQRQLVSKSMEVLARSFVADSHRSLDLVRALLITSLWFRTYSRSGQGVIHQLIQTAVNVAVDIGIGGSKQTCSVASDLHTIDDYTALEARRAWLSCFVASSAMSIVMRHPDTNTWTEYHDECLEHLAVSELLPTDRLLYCYTTSEKLCNHVVSELSRLEPSARRCPNNRETKLCTSRLRQEIEDWQNQLPESTRGPPLTFYRHLALIYLNEPILYTSSNEATFASPFIPDNITPRNFAAPVVTVDHITALYALLDACHGALDIVLELDPSTVHALSSVTFTPRVLYALFILVKLYVAVAAPGNTYGAVMSRSELHLENYFGKMKALTMALSGIDAGSCQTMLIGAHAWLESWFVNYKAIVEQYELRLYQDWQAGPVLALDDYNTKATGLAKAI